MLSMKMNMKWKESKQWSRFLAVYNQLHLAEQQRICGKAAQEHDAPYTDHDESHHNLQESLIASSADRKEGRRSLPVLILCQYCEEYPVGIHPLSFGVWHFA